jgi:catechol 2,3-dioxygenase-like lactoylglutathione lyase family enzyme
MTVLDHVQIAIPEGGEEAGRSFYGRILGLPEIPKPAPLAGRGGCWFAIGGQQLHLGVEKDFRPARKAQVALAVESLTRLREDLAGAGFQVPDDLALEGRARFFADDPFGNRIEFIQIVPAH